MGSPRRYVAASTALGAQQAQAIGATFWSLLWALSGPAILLGWSKVRVRVRVRIRCKASLLRPSVLRAGSPYQVTTVHKVTDLRYSSISIALLSKVARQQ